MSRYDELLELLLLLLADDSDSTGRRRHAPSGLSACLADEGERVILH
ncbi:MAG: hypothetical protein ACYC4M_07470 [Thermoleophilia bacterium]